MLLQHQRQSFPFLKSEIQNPKSKIRNPKSKIQNLILEGRTRETVNYAITGEGLEGLEVWNLEYDIDLTLEEAEHSGRYGSGRDVLTSAAMGGRPAASI